MSSKRVPKEELYPNSTQFPNLLLDEVWPLLTPHEAMVLAVAVRKTLGWHKREETISLSQFCEGTGLGRHTVQKALRALKAVNLIIDLRWQPDGKVYTLNIWDELDYGPIDLDMLRRRREERERAAHRRTKRARKQQPVKGGRMSDILKDVTQPKSVAHPATKDVAQPKGKDVAHPIQNIVKHTNKHKEGGKERHHPDHQRLMALYREAIRGDEGKKKGKELTAPGKENKAAQKILEMGFSPGEAIECYRHFKREPFWRDKHLSLAYIAENISAWEESKSEASRRVPGKAGVSREQRDYYSRHLDPRIDEWRQKPCPHCGRTMPDERRPFLCECQGASEERARRDADLRRAREIVVQEETKKRRERAGLVGRLPRMTFETFDESLQPEAYQKARDFSGDHGENLVLYGPDYGTGKSHLAAAVLNRWINQGGTGRFCEVPTLLRRLRATFSPDARESEHRVFSSIQGAGLLVLDDLGKEKWSPWVEQTLYDVINYRYVRELPVVLTTNLMPGRLGEAIGLACLSRLSERGVFACIRGEDYRLKGRR